MKNINMTGTVYTSFVHPTLDYCDAVWSYCGSVDAEKLEKLHSDDTVGEQHTVISGVLVVCYIFMQG